MFTDSGKSMLAQHLQDWSTGQQSQPTSGLANKLGGFISNGGLSGNGGMNAAGPVAKTIGGLLELL
jgi:hypothetical protein